MCCALARHIHFSPEPYPVKQFLARHVFVCLEGNHAVLLDLRRDQYLALDAATSERLTEIVVGWPTRATRAPDQLSPKDAELIKLTIEDLTQRGLITTDPHQGKSAVPVSVPQPSDTLLAAPEFREHTIAVRPYVQASRTVALLIASSTAALWLRFFPIHRTISRVARAGRVATIEHPVFNESTARQGVSLFYQLRPFLFSAHNACLFDSLALTLFLRRLGVFPQWVFGIRTGPFAAHCWVQHGHIVLNDSVDNVRSYTPIMLV
jgi:hypothetical protein